MNMKLNDAVEGQYLNNTSQGGRAVLLDADSVDPIIMSHAMQAAELTNRDIGGIDVLLAKDGTHKILEVNSTPAIATGVYLEEKIELYRAFFEMEGTQD